MKRRTFLAGSMLGALSGSIMANQADKGMFLGFSSYGMPKFTPEKAIDEVAKIGFDAIEIDAARDKQAQPNKLDKSRRKAIKQRLADRGLALTSIMVHVKPSDPKTPEYLKEATELANDLAGMHPPVVQTTLGSGKWEAIKQVYVKQLAAWVKIAEQAKVVIAIKPHRGGGMSKPVEAAWLIDQLGDSPHLRMVYDYSHYAFRNMPLKETVKTALPKLGHVAVKDAVEKGGRVEFKLPGEAGTINFVELLTLLKAGGYHSDISCEVSGMVWGKPGYDPIKAAQTCYRNISNAFSKAGIVRRRRAS